MPALRTYNLFISHAWDYRDEYHRLVSLLSSARNFSWKDFSVPFHHPLDTATNGELREALWRQIRLVHVVLVISGVYATHRDWIRRELELAEGFSKPIIAIVPRGNTRISGTAQDFALEVVNWNTESIVRAIRTHAP